MNSTAHRHVSLTFSVLALAVIAGCSSSPTSAPVVDRTSISAPKPVTPPSVQPTRSAERDSRPSSYTVKKGDTLYGIALEFGFDYRELADWNGLENPNLIKVGQILALTAPDVRTPRPSVEAKPLAAQQSSGMVELKTQPKAIKTMTGETIASKPDNSITPPLVVPPKPDVKAVKPDLKSDAKPDPKPDVAPEIKPDSKPAQVGETDAEEISDWGWPTQGKVIANFNDGSNKGIDISGSLGQPVVASAAGKVVYSGTGLRGYGKLLIIKHNKTYLSAYAHNHQILVKEGQAVAKGQKIAEMGNSDSEQIKLHFEVRRFGKPVDPIKYLGNEKTQ